jgi:two-component system catabolic regulation response regulator CreB
MTTVLVVEDDEAIAEALAYALGREGYKVERAGTLAAARASLERLETLEAPAKVDLLVLDLTLPDGSGFTLLGELRSLCGPRAPRVIVLTSRDEDVDCVAALEAGADDYVTKPFSPRALMARARAVLRRGERVTQGDARTDGASLAEPATGLAVDGERRVASWSGRVLALTKLEFDLLAALARAPGRVHTRGQLLDRVWGESVALTERTVDSHLKGLRRKLEEAGAPATLVETVRGVGFKLREGSET